jgi:membrane protease YdiL (CAAX protease family)
MLFAVKRWLVPTLALLVLVVMAALQLRAWLGLTWSVALQGPQLRDLLIAVLVMAGSDGGVHALLSATFGERYRVRYRALAEYFRPQRAPEIVAGGLLAGGEELLFRGVMLEGLQSLGGVGSWLAVALTALLFGLLHAIPSRALLPFALWAVWEGALLGGVYVLSGSLAVVVLVHMLHDIAGFSLFAYQRQRWGSRAT